MLRRDTVTIATDNPLAEAEPLQLKAPRRSAMGSVIGHTGFNVARYHTTHIFGALFPLLAGTLLFGWRADAVVMIVFCTTVFAGLIWRRIGTRGHALRPTALLWLGTLMSLMLPATLLKEGSSWPILPLAGLLLVMVCWAFGALGSGRFHPVLLVYLTLAILYGPQLTSQAVLQRNRLMMGDLQSMPAEPESKTSQFAWRSRPILPRDDALRFVPPSVALLDFTRQGVAPDGTPVSLESLLRDHMPPLEDLVLGAVPGSIGTTSAVAVIIGGLFLLHRSLIDFRIPLLITLWAWIALMVLPIHTNLAGDGKWQWLPSHLPGVGWAMGVSLANYEILASPLLFTAFFLAGAPSVRPLSRRGRTVYAIIIGLLAALFQLYVSVSFGAYLALLLVGVVTPWLDRCLAARPLV